jgi:putative ABC transport system ATP-binding protein
MFNSHLKHKNDFTNGGSNKSNGPLIELRQVIKTFETAAGPFTALKGIDLHVNEGELVTVIGKSGSGKTTLNNMITGIDRPTAGEVYVRGAAVHTLNEGQVAEWRGKNIGIIFQFFQLIPTLTILENMVLPMDFCNTFPRRERKERAMRLLEQVEVADQAHKFPSALSGGQQQRVAVARALANDPPILIADEPTGNLDTKTAEAITELFVKLVEQGKTMLMVTHDQDLTRWANRTIVMADGQIANGTGYPEEATSQTTEVSHAN